MTYYDVLGIGALNWDLIYEVPDLDIFSRLKISVTHGQEVYLEDYYAAPLLNLLDRYGTKRIESGGGQAANTIYALSQMGFKTRIIGKAGCDSWGDLIIKGLIGVDTTGVVRQGNSGLCVSLLTPDGERSMIVFPNVNDSFKIEDVDLSDASTRCFHVTSFASQGPLAAQIEIVKGIGRGVIISFDPGSLYARLGLDALRPLLRMTSCLFATDTELEMMTGLGHSDAVKCVRDCGVEMVICKQGAKGAYFMDDTHHAYFPALKADIRDVTGAGDCFAAGFLAGLLKGFNIDKCGRLGTLAAAACIQGYGRASYPDKGIFDLVG